MKGASNNGDSLGPGQILAKLKDLKNQCGERYYERAVLVDRLLVDKQWLREAHGDDEVAAIKTLEDDLFDDLCGLVTVTGMRVILKKFPKIEDWRKFKFRLPDLYDAALPRRASKESSEPIRRATLKEVDQLREEKKHLEYVCKQAKKECESKDEKIRQLEAQVRQLTRENAKLEGRVVELEGLLERYRPSKARAG